MSDTPRTDDTYDKAVAKWSAEGLKTNYNMVARELKHALELQERENASLRAERDKFKAQVEIVTENAIRILGQICPEHEAHIKSISFGEFREEYPTKCIYCLRAELSQAKARIAESQGATSQASSRTC